MFKGSEMRLVIFFLLGLITLNSYGQQTEGLLIETTNDALVITDGSTYKFKDLVVNKGMLSTTIEFEKKKSFFLIYESLGSSIINKKIIQMNWQKPLLKVLAITQIQRDSRTGKEFGWSTIYNYEENKPLTYEHINEMSSKIDYDIVSDDKCQYIINILSTKNKFVIDSCAKNIEVPLFFNDGLLVGYYIYKMESLFLQFNVKSDKTFHLNKKLVKNISTKNLTSYNNIAYYMQRAGANEESACLLERILEKFPNRTVAYLNLGDAYWGLDDKAKAIESYQTYIKQMKENGKEKKIPKVVLERVK